LRKNNNKFPFESFGAGIGQEKKKGSGTWSNGQDISAREMGRA